jgi:hypothetical protein
MYEEEFESDTESPTKISNKPGKYPPPKADPYGEDLSPDEDDPFERESPPKAVHKQPSSPPKSMPK